MPLFNIVLSKDNDSGVVVTGCCPFTFGSVMGQEDLFRETSAGSEIQRNNALQARIVWATSVDATSRVYYGVDDTSRPLTLGLDTGVITGPTSFHEVFLTGLGLDTLYAFKVESTSSVCSPGGETLTSETFWFTTGGTLALFSNQIEFVITNEIKTVGFSGSPTWADDLTITPDLTGIESTVRDPIDFVPTLSIPTIGATPAKTADGTMIFTGTPATAVV